jgi:hypothetical protein
MARDATDSASVHRSHRFIIPEVTILENKRCSKPGSSTEARKQIPLGPHVLIEHLAQSKQQSLTCQLLSAVRLIALDIGSWAVRNVQRTLGRSVQSNEQAAQNDNRYVCTGRPIIGYDQHGDFALTEMKA